MKRIIKKEPIEKKRVRSKKEPTDDYMISKLRIFGVQDAFILPLIEDHDKKDIIYAMSYYERQLKDYEDKAKFIDDVCKRCVEKRILKAQQDKKNG